MDGKNILVIGGSSGIGLAIVKELVEKKATVFTASRTSHRMLNHLGVPHQNIDVRQDFTLDNIPKELHGLVYCPGTINLKPFHRIKPADFLAEYEINVLGAVRTLQAVRRNLKRGKGSVVLFSTVASHLGMGFHASIASAKGAVEGLAKSLAAEWVNLQIRVNVVAPSLTDTPLASNLLNTDDRRNSAKKRHPLGRYGTADDIAKAALYLLSDDSSWMTGQTLHLDGGMSSVRLF